MRMLVTGGAGFIGSHLVERLLVDNHDIVVLDDLSSGFAENLPRLRRVKLVVGSVCDQHLVESLARNAQLIYHLAEYIPNSDRFGPGHVVKYSESFPLNQFETCVKGTLNVLEAAKHSRTKLIFASTAAVRGNASGPGLEPASFYGASKLAAEMYCSLYRRMYGLPVIIARLFNVYGPRQMKYVLYDLLQKVFGKERQIVLFGDGSETRDFLYVADAAEALSHIPSQDARNPTYEVGTGKGTRISTLARTVLELTNSKKQLCFTGSSWKGDVHKLVADPTVLLRTDFRFRTSLTDGLEKCIRWYLSQTKNRNKA